MRYQTIHYARGIAALLVAVGHLYYGFFNSTEMITAVGVQAERLASIPNNIPVLWKFLPRSQMWVNVFFLISGFVIEASLAKLKAGQFLVQRAFRIFPVFWVACICQLIFNALIFGREVPNGIGSEVLLLTSVNFLPVDWTLAIEVHFYLLCTITALAGLSAVKRVLVFWIGMGAALVWKLGVSASWLQMLAEGDLLYILFMSFGSLLFVILNDVEKEQIVAKLALLIHAILFFLLVELMLTHPTFVGRLHEYDRANFAAAVAIFVSLLLVEPLQIKIRPLEFLGDISYPLYVLHFPVGWALHVLFIGTLGISPLLSLFASLLSVCALSYLVHLYIEGPSNNFGKTVSKHLRSRSIQFEKA